LSFSSEISGPVNVTLVDPFGKIHFTEKKELNGETGTEIYFGNANLKQGIYMLKVTTPNGEKSFRVIKD
jgi:hypothetical protein